MEFPLYNEKVNNGKCQAVVTVKWHSPGPKITAFQSIMLSGHGAPIAEMIVSTM
jgi:hypothetical protein